MPETIRKLPKCWRVVNFWYKVIMGLISATNFALIMLDNGNSVHIPELYFEILSTLLAAIPVVWSNLLDSYKERCEDVIVIPSDKNSVQTQQSLTPPDSPV